MPLVSLRHWQFGPDGKSAFGQPAAIRGFDPCNRLWPVVVEFFLPGKCEKAVRGERADRPTGRLERIRFTIDNCGISQRLGRVDLDPDPDLPGKVIGLRSGKPFLNFRRILRLSKDSRR